MLSLQQCAVLVSIRSAKDGLILTNSDRQIISILERAGKIVSTPGPRPGTFLVRASCSQVGQTV